MITKILGFGDLMVVLLMLLSPIVPLKFMIYAALWLIIKGGIFAFGGDIASYLDVFSGIYILFYSFGMSFTFISFLVGFYLGQKFMVSWL